jgi:transposase
MLSDAQWALLEPLIEACRPKGKTPPQDLRRTLSAILWRHQKRRQVAGCPGGAGPLVARRPDLHPLGTSGRLGAPAEPCSGAWVKLGWCFLDGTSVRAHQKAAGARRKGDLKLSETIVKPLAALVAAMAPRLV